MRGSPRSASPRPAGMLIQLRPSPGVRADVLGAYAWERGIRRLAVVAGGDGFGRAVRAAVAARWRKQGGQLTHEESVSLDASDLRSRLRAAMRSGPEALVLGFEGAALGEAAREPPRGRLHGAHPGRGRRSRRRSSPRGRALDGAMLLSDAFVPIPGSRGARFARAYEARHGQPPSRFAASAYEVAILLAEAAERSLASGRGVTASRLRDVLDHRRPLPVPLRGRPGAPGRRHAQATAGPVPGRRRAPGVRRVRRARRSRPREAGGSHALSFRDGGLDLSPEERALRAAVARAAAETFRPLAEAWGERDDLNWELARALGREGLFPRLVPAAPTAAASTGRSGP